jgi:aryl-alcohol dehydrogenase-like predicted oxidoreductase
MNTRPLGPLGPVSALTLGGGGLGQVWGTTSRDEAIATAREAVAAGITLLDLAPSYGRDGEAERVIGEAFGGRLPDGVRITTKHQLGNPPPSEVYARLSASLTESLARMRLQRVDIFILHGMIDADAPAGATTRVSLSTFRDAVIPAFERLKSDGRIGAWGITAVGVPASIIQVLEGSPKPAVAQCIANLLDSPGGMQRFEGEARPREIIAAAGANGVGVMGIRAVQAGALTSAIDRDLPPESPEARDFQRAAPFRALSNELGPSPAFLAHRYALSMPGVSTVVLGVKNRTELRECLAAEAEGPLDAATLIRIEESVR